MTTNTNTNIADIVAAVMAAMSAPAAAAPAKPVKAGRKAAALAAVTAPLAPAAPAAAPAASKAIEINAAAIRGAMGDIRQAGDLIGAAGAALPMMLAAFTVPGMMQQTVSFNYTVDKIKMTKSVTLNDAVSIISPPDGKSLRAQQTGLKNAFAAHFFGKNSAKDCAGPIATAQNALKAAHAILSEGLAVTYTDSILRVTGDATTEKGKAIAAAADKGAKAVAAAANPAKGKGADDASGKAAKGPQVALLAETEVMLKAVKALRAANEPVAGKTLAALETLAKEIAALIA